MHVAGKRRTICCGEPGDNPGQSHQNPWNQCEEMQARLAYRTVSVIHSYMGARKKICDKGICPRMYATRREAFGLIQFDRFAKGVVLSVGVRAVNVHRGALAVEPNLQRTVKAIPVGVIGLTDAAMGSYWRNSNYVT